MGKLELRQHSSTNHVVRLLDSIKNLRNFYKNSTSLFSSRPGVMSWLLGMCVCGGGGGGDTTFVEVLKRMGKDHCCCSVVFVV